MGWGRTFYSFLKEKKSYCKKEMLAIIICYHSFFEFLPFQLLNLKQFVKTPFRVYLVDNSRQNGLPDCQHLPLPITYIRCPIFDNSPSGRHQAAVNLGLHVAWPDNDSFLLMDNDMIFLSSFTEPKYDLCYTPTFRGKWNYCWMNLFYCKKILANPIVFGFHKCPETGEMTDSGGTSGFLLMREDITKQKIEDVLHPVRKENALPSYQEAYKKLCDTYGIDAGYDLFDIEGTEIFHFRALSNYLNHPEEFLSQKKKLILESFWDVMDM